MTPIELRALADALETTGRPGGICQQAANYLRQCAEQKPVAYRLSETDIYDFAGWLTTRAGVMTVGRTSDSSQMAEAVGEYIRKFPDRFTAAPVPPQREPLSEAQCAELSEWMWQEMGISLSNATLRRLEKKLNSTGGSNGR